MIEYNVVGNKVYARFAGDEPDSYQLVYDIFKNKDLSVDYKDKVGRYADKLTEHGLVGVAKCSPEDEFDLETGKRIAKARLLQKYYKKKEKVYLKVSEVAYQLAAVARNIENYCTDEYYKYLEEETV